MCWVNSVRWSVQCTVYTLQRVNSVNRSLEFTVQCNIQCVNGVECSVRYTVKLNIQSVNGVECRVRYTVQYNIHEAGQLDYPCYSWR